MLKLLAFPGLIIGLTASPVAAQAPAGLQGAWQAVEYVDEDDERIRSSAAALIVFLLPGSAVVAEDPDDIAFKTAAACTLSFSVSGEELELRPGAGTCPDPATAATRLRFRLTGDELILYNDAVPNRTAYRRVGVSIP